MLRLARWGVDAILSDDPALLKSTLSTPAATNAETQATTS
jgi:hypothetical protein